MCVCAHACVDTDMCVCAVVSLQFYNKFNDNMLRCLRALFVEVIIIQCRFGGEFNFYLQLCKE